MITVVDANVAVEIALQTQLSEKYYTVLKNSDLVIAPDLFVSEVTSAFYKYQTLGSYLNEVYMNGIEFCLNIVDDYIDSASLWREAYSEGIRFKHPTYDMFYLVCARRNSALLLTRDKKLNEIAKKSGIEFFK